MHKYCPGNSVFPNKRSDIGFTYNSWINTNVCDFRKEVQYQLFLPNLQQMYWKKNKEGFVCQLDTR